MQLGDTVNLVRKYTGELLPMELTKVLVHGTKPAVEVRWKGRSLYKLDLDGNKVIAIDSTQHHRQQMSVWYTISEEHRRELTALYHHERKRRK